MEGGWVCPLFHKESPLPGRGPGSDLHRNVVPATQRSRQVGSTNACRSMRRTLAWGLGELCDKTPNSCFWPRPGARRGVVSHPWCRKPCREMEQRHLAYPGAPRPSSFHGISVECRLTGGFSPFLIFHPLAPSMCSLKLRHLPQAEGPAQTYIGTWSDQLM